MDKDDETALTKLHVHLVRALYVDDDFLDFVYASNLFTDDHIYRIRAKDTPQDKARELLLTLRRRGPKAFGKFLDALEQTGRENIATALRLKLVDIREARKNKRPPVSAAHARDERDAAEELTPELSKCLVTDKRYEVLRDSDVYAVSPILSGGFRGHVLLINNVSFRNHEDREGSDLDADALSKLFGEMHYRVTTHKDLPARKMEKVVKEFLNDEMLHGSPVSAADGDNAKVHLTVVCILTHGEDGAVYGSDDQLLQVDKLVQLMTAKECPLLAGQPKWLFLQACRGGEQDLVSLVSGDQATRDGGDHELTNDAGAASVAKEPAASPEVQRASFHREFPSGSQDSQCLHAVPTESDILVSYSSCANYVAWRSRTQGSWYVQDFVKTLTEASGEQRNGPPRWKLLDVQSLLTLTNNLVSQRSSASRALQTCEYQSRLRKLLFLQPESRAKWTF